MTIKKPKIAREPRKKMEWSKLFCSVVASGFGIYGMWCGWQYYELSKLAILNNSGMPDATLAVTCVTMIIASLLSYLLYQMGLKHSRNKYGIDASGQPFKTSPTVEELMAEEAAEEALENAMKKGLSKIVTTVKHSDECDG